MNTTKENRLVTEFEDVLYETDLDIVGNIFGLKFRDGGSYGLVDLYIEDDEIWHYKMTFDRLWLKDLFTVSERGIMTTDEIWGKIKA